MSGLRRLAGSRLLPYLVLAALAVGMIWRCTLAGKVMAPADLLLIMEPWKHYSHQFPEFRQVSNPILDAMQQFYPWRQFAGESLRSGQVPLWNPHELCGNPFVGNNQSAVFYPETWLHALMPTYRALGWATALYFFLSGALMYGFLRTLRLRRAACVFGAVAFMFNGFVIGWLCFPSFRSVAGWLPGMLLGLELMLRGDRAKGFALCALCGGLQFLAGNLHISLYILIAFAAYAVFRCVQVAASGDRGQAVGAAPCAVGALAASGMLAAAQLVPAVELAGMSSRAHPGGYRELLLNGLALPGLLAGLMPDLFGNPVDYNHWGAELGKVYRAYTETTFYVGVLPVVFAPLAFRYSRREAGFWMGLVIVAVLLAVGSHLNAVLYYLVPFFKSLSGIGRAVVIVSAGLSVLGAYGLHGLLEMARREPAELSRAVVRAALAVGLVGCVGGLWVWIQTGALEEGLPGIGGYTLLQVGRFLAVLLVGATAAALMTRNHRLGVALVIAVLALDLYLYVDKFTPAMKPEYLHIQARAIETMQTAPGDPRILSLGPDPIHRMAPNTPMLAGLEDIQGSDSLEIGLYRALLNSLCAGGKDFPQPDPSLPAIDLLGVGFVHSGQPIEGLGKLREVSSYDGSLYANENALPRAFRAGNIRFVSTEEAMRRCGAADFAPEKETLISGVLTGGAREGVEAAQRLLGERRGPGSGPLTCERGMNAVRIGGDIRAGEVLVLSDTFYPGWRAYQGGAELPVFQADCALRAVQARQDGKEVLFVYTPGSSVVGGFLTLLACGLIAGALTCSAARRRAQG